MVKYKNLTIIGTSHISEESVKKVRKTIEELHPDIVALELDKDRFLALISQKRKINLGSIMKLGFKGFLFNFFGSFIEKSLSKRTGILPGTEMKTAILLAKEKKIKIALIDQPVHITIRKLVSQITRKEKVRFIKDIFSALFLRKKRIKFDLNKVPSEKIIDKLIKETKDKYPTVYKILVKERSNYMTKILNKLIEDNKDMKILAIIGAGHVKDIVGGLKLTKN